MFPIEFRHEPAIISEYLTLYYVLALFIYSNLFLIRCTAKGPNTFLSISFSEKLLSGFLQTVIILYGCFIFWAFYYLDYNFLCNFDLASSGIFLRQNYCTNAFAKYTSETITVQ